MDKVQVDNVKMHDRVNMSSMKISIGHPTTRGTTNGKSIERKLEEQRFCTF